MWQDGLYRVALVWFLAVLGQAFYASAILHKPVWGVSQIVAVVVAGTVALAFVIAFLFYKKTMIFPIFRILSFIVGAVMAMATFGILGDHPNMFNFAAWDTIELGLMIGFQAIAVLLILIGGVLYHQFSLQSKVTGH